MFHNLRHLSYLVAVAEHGSITEAARKLLVSQPAISAAIKGCEAEFGVSLFTRNPAHGLSVTPSGREFVKRAKQLLNDAEDLQRTFSGAPAELTGRLEVGCYASSAPILLPPVINAMARKHPALSIGIHEGDFEEVVRALKSGNVEVGLTYDMYVDSAVRLERIAELSPYVLLSANDPLARQRLISLKDLENRQMVLLDIPGYRDFFQTFFTMHGLQPTVGYRPKTFEMVRGLVGAAADAYSFGFIKLKNNRTYDGKQLVYRDLKEDLPNASVVLAYNRDHRMTPASTAFADTCRHIMGRLTATGKPRREPAGSGRTSGDR